MEDLIDKLFRAIDAKIKHDKERDSYEGYEWGWHGSHEIEAMERAADDLKESLKEVILEVINEREN